MRNPLTCVRDAWYRFLHNDTLRRKLYITIFQSDTPVGKAFDVALLWCIVLSILVVIVESMPSIPPYRSGVCVYLLLYIRVSAAPLLLSQASQICVQLLRNNRFAQHVASISGMGFRACTLPYGGSYLPSHKGIPRIQAVQLPRGGRPSLAVSYP